MLFARDRAWSVNLNEDILQLHTGNESINLSRSEKLLGGVVSRNLKWADHVMFDQDSVFKKLSQRLNAVKQISYYADFKTRKLLTNGIFISRLSYLMPLWGGCQKFLINALQTMQNRAARYVTKKDVYTPVKTLLTQCGWLSVQQMVFYHTVVLFYKTRQSEVPAALYNMASIDYAYSTRAKVKGMYKVVSSIKVPSDLAVRSYRWRSVQQWNMLPTDVKTIKNVLQFKKSLKQWIIKNIDIYP